MHIRTSLPICKTCCSAGYLDGELWAFEIKLTASPGPDDMNRLETAADTIGAARRLLVSQTRRQSGDERRASLDLPGVLRLLRGKDG